MNTIVREMNPAEEIELTDAQLSAVYGAWGEECQPQYQARPVYQVCEVKPICQEQAKSSSLLVQKKVVVVYEEDFLIKKDEEAKSYGYSC